MAHPDLVNVGAEMIDMILTDPTTSAMAYRGLTTSEAQRRLRSHRNVLVRCQQVV